MTTKICVAPDYVLCPKSVLDAFVASLIEHAKTFWPDGSLKSSVSRIISNSHFSRLSSILKRTKANIVYGGGKDLEGIIDPAGRKRGLEVTIFVLDKEHSADDALMNEYVKISLWRIKTNNNPCRTFNLW